jgi:hypothetical protein
MNPVQELTDLDRCVADATLGIDTLWGGDVMHHSGEGRFVADCWFSDAPLPLAYTHPAAARLRQSRGIQARMPDRDAISAYLEAVDVRGAVRQITDQAKTLPARRRNYLKGLADCLDVMWDMAMEILGKGEAVPYERCVRASTGMAPRPSDPVAKRRRVRELLDRAGYPSSGNEELHAAVDAWRRDRMIPSSSMPALSSAFVAELDGLTQRNLMPYIPKAFHAVPRANIRFSPITGSYFSGSMNYLGRARKADGSPEYEANYEINGALQISVPEFQMLIGHEVVPGHVMTYAFMQNMYVRDKVLFEATVLPMNSLGATLYEGLANNALLIAHGTTEIDQLPDKDIQIGMLLSLLQDDAKNQSSYLIWKEGISKKEVAMILRHDYLVSEERAEKLSGVWGHHPLLGRMTLPAYRAGTEKVAELRRKYPPDKVLPALFGCRGLVDIRTVESAIAGQ